MAQGRSSASIHFYIAIAMTSGTDRTKVTKDYEYQKVNTEKSSEETGPVQAMGISVQKPALLR